jgi:hypothetical protein
MDLMERVLCRVRWIHFDLHRTPDTKKRVRATLALINSGCFLRILVQYALDTYNATDYKYQT